jgi:hypothetical protein
MADVVSNAELSVNIAGPGAALKKLERVKNIDIKDGRTTEVVMAVGVSRGAGWRRKQGGFEIDMVSYRQVGRAPEVDWFIVNEAYSTFTILQEDTEQGVPGYRYAYLVKISKIDSKTDAEGNLEDTITLACKSVARS